MCIMINFDTKTSNNINNEDQKSNNPKSNYRKLEHHPNGYQYYLTDLNVYACEY